MNGEGKVFAVCLASAGNPDHGQFFDAGILSPGLHKRCASIPECQRAVRDYIEQHGLGAGNFIGGEVTVDGKRVGRISYNGRFWPVEHADAAKKTL